MPRAFKQIAQDIKSIWLNVNYEAEQLLYVLAKEDTSDPTAPCTLKGMESYTVGEIADYFLDFSRSFRGKDARALKAELRSLLHNKESNGAIRVK